MKTINNNGEGNCMYYAYSISLMYYLRSEQDHSKVDAILGQFPAQRKALQTLLDNNKNVNEPFSSNDTNKIQQLLGPACRALAGDTVRKEFLASPQSSQLFTNSVWKIAKKIREHIAPRYKRYITTGSDPDKIFSKAEIYRVKGINAAMNAYSEAVAQDVVAEFNKEGGDKIILSSRKAKKMKQALMDSIIEHKTISFFTNENHKYLASYVNHLKTNQIWGSAETLAIFHNALTTMADTPIHLTILKNDRYTDASEQARLKMLVMNNYNDTHWVSVIPEKFLSTPPQKILHSSTNDTRLKDDIFINNALNKIGFLATQNAYKEALTQMIKQTSKLGIKSNIKNIDNAQAYVDPVTHQQTENDEDFAKRLQLAEIESLRMSH